MKKKLASLFVFITFAFSAQIPTNGLLGSWTFNGNANDVTGNNNNGSVIGATLTADRFGNPNSAYSFNGSNNYILMQNPGPSGSVSRSLSFWAKSSSNSIMAAFDYGTIMVGGCFHILFNYNCQGVGFDVAGGIMTYGNTTLADNSWHHYAAVYNSTISTQMNNVIIYVDGVVQPNLSCYITSTVTNLNTGTADPITIGRTAGAATRYFNGQLDDYYFYNRALSQSEILDLYNYSPCSLPVAGSINGNTLVCPGVAKTYSVAPVPGASSYVWTLPSSWTGSSSTNTISCNVGSNSGVLSVAASNSCGTSGASTLVVTSDPNVPQISASSADLLICKGNTVALACNGANTYTWQPGNLSGFMINVSPTITTTYTITGTSPSGCSNTAMITQSVEVCSGINVEDGANRILIYPNPFSDILTVSCETDMMLSVNYLSGEEVLSRKLYAGETVLKTDELSPGIYIVVLRNTNGAKFAKFVKH